MKQSSQIIDLNIGHTKLKLKEWLSDITNWSTFIYKGWNTISSKYLL